MIARCFRRLLACVGAYGIASSSGVWAANEFPSGPAIRATAAASAEAVAYRIHDIGRPPPSMFSDSMPVAFNDAGQIAGEGTTAANGDPYPVRHCIVWNGTGRFIDITPSPDTSNCDVESISDPDAKRTSHVVGGLTVPYMQSIVPFEATIAPYDVTATHVFSDRLGMLFGVNAKGEANGIGTQEPIAKNEEGSGYFVVLPGSTAFVPAQPSCLGVTESCLEPNDILSSCPFGGCSINDAGVLLGHDRATGHQMIYVYGMPKSGRDLPFGYSSSFGDRFLPEPVLNGAGQILYDAVVSGAVVPYVFAIATAVTTRIPPLSNNSCNSYVANSMNDAGDVLGYTTTCAQPGDAVNWTWSARGGIVALNGCIRLGSYTSVYALGINDDDAILALLYRHGTADWGTLEPTSGGHRRPPLPLERR